MANDESRASDRLKDMDLTSGPAGEDENESSQTEDSGGGDKITIEMDRALAQKLRSAVYYTPGLTMYQVVEKGVEVVIDKLERDRGEPFPDFNGTLDGGRPPSDSPKYNL